MKYDKIVKGTFLERPNRFIAYVDIFGNIETCHVLNTGRCKELLTKGATVYLNESSNTNRKTKYDVVKVLKGEKLINMDSLAPNKAAEEFFKKQFKNVKREVKYKNSRFDLFIKDNNTFIEVKGVTLEKDNIAMFPDAPTERGRKHIYELVDAVKNGYNAKILFVIQFKGAEKFIPNYKTDPEFKKALKFAKENGVEILAYDCSVTEDSMEMNERVEVCLDLSLPI